MASARLRGKYGRLWIGTAAGGSQTYTSVDIENWEVTVDIENEESEGLDDTWIVRLPRVGSWRASFEKFVTTAVGMGAIAAVPAAGGTCFLTCYRGSATGTTAGAQIASGECVWSSGTLSNPVGWAKERFELLGTGALTVVGT